MFGSSISYLTIDLIKIWKNSNENNFEENRDKYLAVENPPEACYYRQLDYPRMQKIIQFIDRYIDSITPENEMKMDIFFNQNEPAFIDDEVNTRLFNFSYADKAYAFAQENKLSIRIHTIVWYRHVPKQLTDYLKNLSAEDKKKLTFKFIKTYMQCLKERYPNAYSMDLINEIAADPDEIRELKEEGQPLYDFDDEGVRIDDNREKQIIFKTVIDNIKKYEKEHGLKLIDGFGMQCHFWGSKNEDRTFMEEMFEQFSHFGVEIQVTEFDVSNHSTKEIQQSIFNNFAEVVQKHGIEFFTTWGLNDIVSWLHGEEASLVDSNCDLKPFTMKYIKAFSERYKNASV